MNETYTQDHYDCAYKDAYDAAYAEGLAAAHAEAERDIAVAMERAKAVGCAEKLDTKLAELRSKGHSPAALAVFAGDFITGFKQGMLEERERCAAILVSPEAKGRESIARYFAMETDLPADQAVAALRSMPSTSSIGARAAETATIIGSAPFQN
jgi:hypothetical protein